MHAHRVCYLRYGTCCKLRHASEALPKSRQGSSQMTSIALQYLSQRGTGNRRIFKGAKQLLRPCPQVFSQGLGHFSRAGYWALVQHVVPHGVHILWGQQVVLRDHAEGGSLQRVRALLCRLCTGLHAATMHRCTQMQLQTACSPCDKTAAIPAHQLCNVLSQFDVDACSSTPLGHSPRTGSAPQLCQQCLLTSIGKAKLL